MNFHRGLFCRSIVRPTAKTRLHVGHLEYVVDLVRVDVEMARVDQETVWVDAEMIWVDVKEMGRVDKGLG